MVKPEIKDGNLILHMEGMDKVWALKSELTIPLSHITGVRMDGEVVHEWFHGLKLPGSNIPGVLTAGTFYWDGKRVFWDIHRPTAALVISLDHESYNELVIEVEDPSALIDAINKLGKS
jgi:hypothetical protein